MPPQPKGIDRNCLGKKDRLRSYELISNQLITLYNSLSVKDRDYKCFGNSKGNSNSMGIKGYNNFGRKQNVYNKSPSYERLCNTRGRNKKGQITQNKRDIGRIIAMHVKHGVNKEFVTKYVYDKGKTSRVDGAPNISCHMPIIMGGNFDMDKTDQPKTKDTNNKGG